MQPTTEPLPIFSRSDLSDQEFETALSSHLDNAVGHAFTSSLKHVVQLPPSWRMLALTLAFEGVFDDSGLPGVYWNDWDGDIEHRIHATADAYRILGETRLAELLEESIAVYEKERALADGLRRAHTSEAYLSYIEGSKLNAIEAQIREELGGMGNWLSDTITPIRAQWAREHAQEFVNPIVKAGPSPT